ncbi:hypothetical protein TEA_010558 [Camellia sinensis var. sinensis]|uniref:PI31 proteasome regulator C-terminal domain-containing protein n=1 Tax=Camellia sinensis var. sinensis TaxID=542762 RepID=A0A4S4E370_CAMSN|nr:hypothetical protein TEA_010558 [Camellia sinensis var. sinensis]
MFFGLLSVSAKQQFQTDNVQKGSVSRFAALRGNLSEKRISLSENEEFFRSFFPGFLIVYPPVYPVGGSDLFPGPGAGMYPTRGDFGIGGGGMFVGPDHPMFGGMGRGIGPILPGGLPGVPLGARFDPYGPPGVPGFEPNRFARRFYGGITTSAGPGPGIAGCRPGLTQPIGRDLLPRHQWSSSTDPATDKLRPEYSARLQKRPPEKSKNFAPPRSRT